MINMKFYISSLGCKVNIFESEAVAFDLKKRGWIVSSIDPDVIIINTCTVTQMSDSKSRKLIRQLIRSYPNAICVVMGCYSQLDSTNVSQIEGVDIVIGTNNRGHIYELIEEFRLFKKPINKVSDSSSYKTFEELKLNELTIHTRGFIKVQDGCENFCSYCAIPYARGPIKSRNMESIIAEIKDLVSKGVKEIVLAGINTGTYGKDLDNLCLAVLIDQILTQVPNLYRLRLSSIELMEITDELLNILKKHEKKVANHLHIPLQSGCDETLIRMNRKYLMKDFFEKVTLIRKMFKDIAITTDCLAGFVGETVDEFNTTYNNIKEIAFSDSHIFPYSRRKNTKADQMDGHLDPTIIKDRAHKLQSLAKDLKLEYYQKFLGQEMEVLFEQEKNGYWYGHTSNYLEVKIKKENVNLINQILNVKLIKIINGVIFGEEI